MATIAEVLEIEKQRIETKEWNVIHLFKEGSFYHAYEWSAFLIAVVSYNDEARKQTPDRKPISVTRKSLKNQDGTFAFVGFPLNSIEKYIPKACTIEFNPVTDTLINISIKLPAESFLDINEEKMTTKLNEWKEQHPVKDDKKSRNGGENNSKSANAQRSVSITGLLARVLSFPLERKSPVEAYDFLSELKQDLSAIF